MQSEESDTQLGVLTLHNCRLKKTNFKDMYENRMYGFVIMAKGAKHEFYNYKLSEILDWIRILSVYVVNLDLKEDWIVQGLIGKGNSAKVHRAERKSQRNKFYAMKTVEKSHINKNPQNQVSDQYKLGIRGLRVFCLI